MDQVIKINNKTYLSFPPSPSPSLPPSLPLPLSPSVLTQNITFGRVAALFYYIYSMCKRFLKDTFANHTLIQTLMSLGGYLVLSLVKVKFFQWLSDQGGWVSKLLIIVN